MTVISAYALSKDQKTQNLATIHSKDPRETRGLLSVKYQTRQSRYKFAFRKLTFTFVGENGH